MKKNNIWSSLNKGEKIRVNKNVDLFAYITSSGYNSILIEFNKRYNFTSLTKLKFENFYIQASDDKKAIYLILQNNALIDIFHYLSMDIIEHIIDQPENIIINQIQLVVNIWKDLMREKKDDLPEITQRGLFSELMFIQDNIFKKQSYAQDIMAWNGPEGGVQDFSFNECDVEIKSIKHSNKNEIKISSENQLNKNNDYLYLICYYLKTDNNGKTIKDISWDIINNITNEEIKELFIKKLLKYGYYVLQEYDGLIPFTIDKTSVYNIDENFPKIINNNIDIAISKVSYTIDLSVCNTLHDTKIKGV